MKNFKTLIVGVLAIIGLLTLCYLGSLASVLTMEYTSTKETVKCVKPETVQKDTVMAIVRCTVMCTKSDETKNFKLPDNICEAICSNVCLRAALNTKGFFKKFAPPKTK